MESTVHAVAECDGIHTRGSERDAVMRCHNDILMR